MNASSFIISDGVPVAIIEETDVSGAARYGYQRCEEAINANRKWNLVNARPCRVSRAKKWQGWERRNNVLLPISCELNDKEFFVLAGQGDD